MWIVTAAREQKSLDKFRRKYNEWRDRIRKTLKQSGVKSDVVEDIPFVPAGHKTEPRLFEELEPWMEQFAKCVLVRRKGHEANGGLWRALREHVLAHTSTSTIECHYG